MKLKPADIWFSKCIRRRDRMTCQRCGKVFSEPAQGLDCSHHFGRGRKSTRWDANNASALCFTCHRNYHDYPPEGYRWLEGYLGKGMVSLIEEKSNQTVKITKKEEKEIASHYRKEYRRMIAEDSYDFVSYQ